MSPKIRQLWRNLSPDTPINISDIISDIVQINQYHAPAEQNHCFDHSFPVVSIDQISGCLIVFVKLIPSPDYS